MTVHDRPARRLGRHVVLLGTVLIMIFPLLWALTTSFKPANNIYSTNPLPLPATLGNYRFTFAEFPIARLLLNTFVMASGATLLQLVVSVPAAYALVRLRTRGQGLVLVALTVALVVPAQALIIPHFLLATRLEWRNTYLGLVVPQLATSALAVLLLREHVRKLPPTLASAAILDGATAWEVLRFIVLPLLRPSLAAVGIIVFINTWNEYLWPSLIAPGRENTTIQVGLALFGNQEGQDFGPLLAAAMISTLPIVAVYMFASRRIADAFLQSGLR
ncbi:carbohydrate ABC transporter permease [Candidatus Protofrankia californiensis]|uniref:carbohydrate ABC transporter permease n=1 Tax=Candidatus Protofrankia californiensis TaxID=1839754 RepID=UPI001F4961F8|nr:carbohydrate ABC transporter permease [Candidatus Protofrankia californiensis]